MSKPRRVRAAVTCARVPAVARAAVAGCRVHRAAVAHAHVGIPFAMPLATVPSLTSVFARVTGTGVALGIARASSTCPGRVGARLGVAARDRDPVARRVERS
jgi:hypothetical protein